MPDPLPLRSKFSSVLATCRDDGLFPRWPKAFLDQQANQKQSLVSVHETSWQPLNQTTGKQAPKVARFSPEQFSTCGSQTQIFTV